MAAWTTPVAGMTHRGVAARVICLAALSAACQQKPSAAVPQTNYQVRLSASAERVGVAQAARAFARVCAPADMTLPVVNAANGPANLKNVEDDLKAALASFADTFA